MRRYYGITAPVWIFLFTLVLVIATGGIVGTSPCERTIATCETSAVAAHTNNLTLQQAYVSRCSEAACKSKKSGAAVPFSILILGYVLYRVWTRQGGTPSPARGTTTGTVPSMTPKTAPQEEAKDTAKKSPKKEPKKAPKDSAAAAPSTSTSTSTSKSKTRSNASDTPDRVSGGSSTNTPATVASAPTKASAKTTSKGPTLTAAQKTLYLGTLYFDEETPKDDIARRLSELTGATDASTWKGASASDLGLLAKVIAAAAALGGATSKYREANAGEAPTEAVAGMTKKALHEQSLVTLQRDLDALAKKDFPEGMSKASVEGLIGDLRNEDALDGLSRLSKRALVSLALFLDVS